MENGAILEDWLKEVDLNPKSKNQRLLRRRRRDGCADRLLERMRSKTPKVWSKTFGVHYGIWDALD